MTEYPQGSEDFKRLNPHLFRQQSAKMITAPVESEIVVNAVSMTEQKLNKLERRFLEWLRQHDPPFEHIGIQELKFRIGHKCHFTPDFQTRDRDGRIVIYETKGFMRDDALVKLKVAATNWPCFTWLLVKWDKDRWSMNQIEI